MKKGTMPAMLVFPGLALLLVWGALWWRAEPLWRSQPDYHHGYAIPFLVIWLVGRRWRDRPPGVGNRVGWVFVALGTLALIGWLPILFLFPRWPAPTWLAVGAAALFSGGLLGCLGGWRWVRHFSPALLLGLLAFAWPAALSRPVEIALMQANAYLAAEVVDLLGYPAIAQGTTIAVGSGLVGIEEACSGLRGVQAVLLLALVMGEWARASRWSRSCLLGWAILGTLVANALRSIFLTWVAARSEMSAMWAWHDQAGWAAMVFALVIVLCGGTRLPRTSPSIAVPLVPHSSTRDGIVMFILAMTPWLATFAWWSGAPMGQERGRSHVHLQSQADWHAVPPPTRALVELACTRGEGYTWSEAGGAEGLAYGFYWVDEPVSVALAAGHDPRRCLAALDVTLDRQIGERQITVEGVPLIFRGYRYLAPAGVQYVFFAITLEGRDWGDPDRGRLWRERLGLVRRRQRVADFAQLGLVSLGIGDDESAWEWFGSVANEGFSGD